MKFGLLLITLLIGQIASAQSMREIRIKEMMLDRVDDLIIKAESSRDLLEKKDAREACKTIKNMYDISMEHVRDIHSHMDIFNSKVIDAKNEAVQNLLYLQRQQLICAQGRDNEYVDPKKFRSELKTVISSLKKQRKTIKKKDTDYDNGFTMTVESNGEEIIITNEAEEGP